MTIVTRQKMRFRNTIILLLLASLAVVGANNNDDYDEYAAQADDDDANVQDDKTGSSSNSNSQKSNENIKYWTDYAILPRRCIVYNNVDVIVFSMYEHGYKQCSDNPLGTYVTPVPSFVEGYLNQKANIEADRGNADYSTPDASQYVGCTRQVIQNKEYWLQLGCADGTTQKLAVNIYTDNTCTTRDISADGTDDANIDVSEIQLPFRRCQACVYWVDKKDDEIDDMFYENRQTQAPLCSYAWNSKEWCNKKCQRVGMEKESKAGWNTSDKIILGILSVFAVAMLIAILQKRRSMSNKDALLEQAAMSAAGLQQAHVICIFILVVLVITVFALLGLKNITWALLLLLNTFLFGYLMKLTVDSAVTAGETIIGPDGTIIRRGDSDDSDTSSHMSERKAGNYVVPTIT